MFDFYVMDFCDDSGRHVLMDSDLLCLLSKIDSSVFWWSIFKGERIEGLFYPQRLISRSSLEEHYNV